MTVHTQWSITEELNGPKVRPFYNSIEIANAVRDEIRRQTGQKLHVKKYVLDVTKDGLVEC